MDLYTMRYILAIAEQGKFSLAAEACHVGQPALSQQVAKLERELGTPLFRRNAKGAVLTEAGEEFVLRAREILQKSEALESEMARFAGAYRGTVTLGVITSLQCIRFGEWLSAFCEAYPEVAVNIVQGGSTDLLRQLSERKIDLAFLNRPLSRLPEDTVFTKLGEDIYRLALPASHPLASRKKVSLAELSGERFIFHESTQVASELCLRACRKAGFEPNIVCRSGSPTISLYMVRGGLGIALLPAEEFRIRIPDGVVGLSLKETIRKDVGLARRIDSTSPIVNAMAAFTEKWMRAEGSVTPFGKKENEHERI